MYGILIVALILVLALTGFLAGRARALALSAAARGKRHSRPGHHAGFVMLCTVLPALLLLVAWLIVSPMIIASQVRDMLPQTGPDRPVASLDLSYSVMTSVARGLRQLPRQTVEAIEGDGAALRSAFASNGLPLAQDPGPEIVSAAKRYNALSRSSRLAMAGAVLVVALVGMTAALRMIGPQFPARRRVERIVYIGLVAASSITILTTAGILLSMFFETVRFFTFISPRDFFFGTVWDPRFAAAGNTGSSGQFGLVPLLAGTFYIALVALVVAVPLGLYGAIYLSEYAGARLRGFAKPLLEVLAGIPTIVYGFFALIAVGPFLRDVSAGLNALLTGDPANFIAVQSVLTAGIVIGIMLTPYLSSLCDDIIRAVPNAWREGSLSLGATRSETMKHVILPAAMPGIAGALLLTASRAIGETMIVVLAAGVAAQIHLNPMEPMTTVTVKIVNQLTGDLEFNSPQTLVAFALGLTLFAITLVLNIYALSIVRKFRERYE